jgi:hypothetical protein
MIDKGSRAREWIEGRQFGALSALFLWVMHGFCTATADFWMSVFNQVASLVHDAAWLYKVLCRDGENARFGLPLNQGWRYRAFPLASIKCLTPFLFPVVIPRHNAVWIRVWKTGNTTDL